MRLFGVAIFYFEMKDVYSLERVIVNLDTIKIEVQLLPEIEGANIVDLPDTSVKESKDGVMVALYKLFR